jgi:glycerol-3-phosphate O-acyltransferase
LGFKVLADINDVSVVMPTALVGTVLLTLRGRGVGRTELVRRVEWLSDRIRAKGGRVAHFAGAPTELVVDRALDVLGSNLVGRVDKLAEETYYAVDRFQLSFYRNMTIHLFVSEALVSAALYTKVKRGGGPEHQRMEFSDLLNHVGFLSQASTSLPLTPRDNLTPKFSSSAANSSSKLKASHSI